MKASNQSDQVSLCSAVKYQMNEKMGMRFVAKFFDSFAYGTHLFVGGVRLHYNQHHSPLSEIELSSLLYAGRGLQTGLRYNRGDES